LMRLGYLAKFATESQRAMLLQFSAKIQQELAVRFGATSPPFDVGLP